LPMNGVGLKLRNSKKTEGEVLRIASQHSAPGRRYQLKVGYPLADA
jgi:hypothetical protein